MNLIESLKKKKFVLFNIFFALYISINLIGGERGLISYFDKKQHLKELQMEETLIINKIRDLDFKNSLLSDNLDLDYIETLIRERLLFGKENEKIYIITNDTKN